MQRLLILFASLALALSFGLGSVTHAMEPIACVDVGSEAGIGHIDGDTDTVPGDGDRAYPHHHGGCHGHHVAAPADLSATAPGHDGGTRLIPARVAALGDAGRDSALRPPRA